MNYRLAAIQLGDLLKYETSLNEINRAGQSIFSFRCENFPNNSITSERAKLIHNWILSLAKQSMENSQRNEQLMKFLEILTQKDYGKT